MLKRPQSSSHFVKWCSIRLVSFYVSWQSLMSCSRLATTFSPKHEEFAFMCLVPGILPISLGIQKYMSSMRSSELQLILTSDALCTSLIRMFEIISLSDIDKISCINEPFNAIVMVPTLLTSDSYDSCFAFKEMVCSTDYNQFQRTQRLNFLQQFMTHAKFCPLPLPHFYKLV